MTALFKVSEEEIAYHQQRMTKVIRKISKLMKKFLPDVGFTIVMIQSPTNVQIVAGSHTDPHALKAMLQDGLTGLGNIKGTATFRIDPDDPEDAGKDEMEEGTRH